MRDDDPAGDWTQPGVFRCAPDVYRIPLPLPNDGLRAVNLYAVADGDGWTLIDAGWALAEARDVLEAALGELGAGFGDVRRFLVTHVHRDHYTQAVTLRREFGIPVALGRGERPGLEAIHRPDREGNVNRDRLRLAGADALLRRLEQAPRQSGDLSLWEFPDEWIDDGAEIVVDENADRKRVLRAVATPGHTQGHVVFADEDGDLLFAGDHVLPRITPSIGLEPVAAASPLADFLASLELIRTRPDAALLPAHGPVGMRVHQRVDELIAHHGTRLDATLAAVREGRSTAHEVATALRWTRRERRLDDLDLFNAMLATMETLAHLELLAERGVVTAVDEHGVRHYTT
ncbi:MBL fold metallo-hydrolase [Pseudonocardia nigra]|uniref:MBL fold metallo-hydrolase n=1 Tax=Pseudonocardia nigra TaxID=1921578 RepID=UPI001C5E0256|nr:MBL fold metallo-hydrolase [Pseudonocardia nigra]